MSGVVIEGADGGGKTTLIRKLRDFFGWPVVHVVQPHIPDYHQMMKLLNVGPVIFDRFHWSPQVYGDVLRDGPELDETCYERIEDKLVGEGYTVVLCETNINTMLENNEKEIQLWNEVREFQPLAKLLIRYEKIARLSNIPVFHYDYQERQVEDVIDFVKAGGW